MSVYSFDHIITATRKLIGISVFQSDLLFDFVPLDEVKLQRRPVSSAQNESFCATEQIASSERNEL